MAIVKQLTAYLMGAFYVYAGANHFLNPDFYLDIMPGYLPWHAPLVYLSGAAEIVCGVFVIIPRTRVLGAWLTIALLIAVFPANIHTAMNPEQYDFAPPIGHYIRLPFQGVFILWAFWYTRPNKVVNEEIETQRR